MDIWLSLLKLKWLNSASLGGNIPWTQQEVVSFSQQEVCVVQQVPSAMKKAGLAKNSAGLEVWQEDL